MSESQTNDLEPPAAPRQDVVGQTIERGAAEASAQVGDAAEQLHAVADELRQNGGYMFAAVADEIADRADRFAQYLRECDAERVFADAAALARRAPLSAAIVGAMLGFAAARAFKAHAFTPPETPELPRKRRPKASVR